MRKGNEGLILKGKFSIERLVMGFILFHPELLSHVIEVLSSDIFLSPEIKTIYQVVERLHHEGKQVNIVSVHDGLIGIEKLDFIGGLGALNELVEPIKNQGDLFAHLVVLMLYDTLADLLASDNLDNRKTKGTPNARKIEVESMKCRREDKKVLKTVRKAFQNAPAPRRKMTTTEIVAELYEDIKAMRDKGYPWEQIAEFMGETIGLKASTLRRYYGEAKKRMPVDWPQLPSLDEFDV